jgi:hypothetical protein
MHGNRKFLVENNVKCNIHFTRNKEERRLWSLKDSTLRKLLNKIIFLHAKLTINIPSQRIKHPIKYFHMSYSDKSSLTTMCHIHKLPNVTNGSMPCVSNNNLPHVFLIELSCGSIHKMPCGCISLVIKVPFHHIKFFHMSKSD